ARAVGSLPLAAGHGARARRHERRAVSRPARRDPARLPGSLLPARRRRRSARSRGRAGDVVRGGGVRIPRALAARRAPSRDTLTAMQTGAHTLGRVREWELSAETFRRIAIASAVMLVVIMATG